MGLGALKFFRPADGSGRLVFGDEGAESAVPGADIGIDAGLLGFDPLADSTLLLHYGPAITVDIALPGLDADASTAPPVVSLLWDSNVVRHDYAPRVALGTGWQEGQPTGHSIQSHWQESQSQPHAVQSRWQQAQPQPHGIQNCWQETQPQPHVVQSHWQEGAKIGHSLAAHWQETRPDRAALVSHWQESNRARDGLEAHWQTMLLARAALVSHWQEAQARRRSQAQGWGEGLHRRIGLTPRWQEAQRPPPGVTPRPVPPLRVVCYDPSTLGRLIFSEAPDGSGRLVFVCQRAGVTPPGGTNITIPQRRSYIVINSVEIRRADNLGGPALPAQAFTMQLNRASWTWVWSATLHHSAASALQREAGQPPVEVEVRVNAQPFRLLIERVTRSRRLPEYTITVSGRGKSALLDAPHSPEQTFGTDLERSANQLMTDTLTLGGVSIGWAVDFGLTDWQIPGGTWLHQGTYLSAILDIAGSVGGYVQPHDTAQTVRILKRWPVPAWRLGELTPDIELPLGLSEVDDTEYMDAPAYNRIFVSGETGSGILADLTRAGTAGDVLHSPMAAHPLITTIGAAKARAQSELSDAGPLVRRRMTLPILPATGIIKPGAVLDYWDDSAARRVGIVDATSINQTWPVLVQNLEVMSYA